MTPIRPHQAAQPFNSDPEYLEAEFSWVAARCRYLGARMDAERDALDDQVGPVSAENPESVWPAETRARVSRFAAAETTLRQQTDARLEATREAGIVLGLDRLVDAYELDEIDRQVLVLTAMPACGLELVDVLGTIGSFGFAICSITPELIAVFHSLDLAGRLKLRHRLGPERKLVTARLIEVDVPCGERVQDWPAASIFIEEGAFEVVVGLQSDLPSPNCVSCGQPTGGRA